MTLRETGCLVMALGEWRYIGMAGPFYSAVYFCNLICLILGLVDNDRLRSDEINFFLTKSLYDGLEKEKSNKKKNLETSSS